MIHRQFGHSIQLSSHREEICGKRDNGACQVSCFRPKSFSRSAKALKVSVERSSLDDFSKGSRCIYHGHIEIGWSSIQIAELTSSEPDGGAGPRYGVRKKEDDGFLGILHITYCIVSAVDGNCGCRMIELPQGVNERWTLHQLSREL